MAYHETRPNNADINKPGIFRCIIVDDEPIARHGMAKLVAHTPSLYLQASLASAEEAKEWLSHNSTDLLFLDIEMPGLSGIDFASSIQGDIGIIFTTAHSEYAARSYDVEAVDYLLKPISPSRFAKAVQRAFSLIHRPQSIIIRADRHNIRINTSSITYIEGMKDYVKIHCLDRRIISRATIKTLLDSLPATDFVRIHKSYIVNIRHVTAYDSSSVEIAHRETAATSSSPAVTLPLGASYRSDFEKKMGNKYNA